MSFLLGALAVLITAAPAEAQERDRELPRLSPSASVSQVIGITEITINYGRPSVREREIFGELVPFHTVWRTGADEATTITFSDDVTFEGELVSAGTYALFTIPDEDDWQIILNEEPDQWGAYGYDQNQDLLRITVSSEEADFREMMTFYFEEVDATSANIVLHWDEVRVPFRVETDTDEIVKQRANEIIPSSDSWQEPLRFASYAMRNGVFLDEALQWVNRSIELQENFNNLYVKARLLAHQGQYAEAVEVGERAVEHAGLQDQRPVTLDELKNEMREWEMRW